MAQKRIRVLHPNHYTGHRIEHEEFKTEDQLREEFRRKRIWKGLNLLGIMLLLLIVMASEIIPYWFNHVIQVISGF